MRPPRTPRTTLNSRGLRSRSTSPTNPVFPDSNYEGPTTRSTGSKRPASESTPRSSKKHKRKHSTTQQAVPPLSELSPIKEEGTEGSPQPELHCGPVREEPLDGTALPNLPSSSSAPYLAGSPVQEEVANIATPLPAENVSNSPAHTIAPYPAVGAQQVTTTNDTSRDDTPRDESIPNPTTASSDENVSSLAANSIAPYPAVGAQQVTTTIGTSQEEDIPNSSTASSSDESDESDDTFHLAPLATEQQVIAAIGNLAGKEESTIPRNPVSDDEVSNLIGSLLDVDENDPLSHETTQFGLKISEQGEEFARELYLKIREDHRIRKCECGTPTIYGSKTEALAGRGHLRFYIFGSNPKNLRVIQHRNDPLWHCLCDRRPTRTVIERKRRAEGDEVDLVSRDRKSATQKNQVYSIRGGDRIVAIDAGVDVGVQTPAIFGQIAANPAQSAVAAAAWDALSHVSATAVEYYKKAHAAFEPYYTVESRVKDPFTHNIAVKRVKRQYCPSMDKTVSPKPVVSTDKLAFYDWADDQCRNIGPKQAIIECLMRPLEKQQKLLREGRVHYDTTHIAQEAKTNDEAGFELDLSQAIRFLMVDELSGNSEEDFKWATEVYSQGIHETLGFIKFFYLDEGLMPWLKLKHLKPPSRLQLGDGNQRWHIRRAAEFLGFVVKQWKHYNIEQGTLTAISKMILDADAVHKQEVAPSMVEFPGRNEVMPGTFPLDEHEDAVETIQAYDLSVEGLYHLQFPSDDSAPAVDDVAEKIPSEEYDVSAIDDVAKSTTMVKPKGILKSTKEENKGRQLSVPAADDIRTRSTRRITFADHVDEQSVSPRTPGLPSSKASRFLENKRTSPLGANSGSPKLDRSSVSRHRVERLRREIVVPAAGLLEQQGETSQRDGQISKVEGRETRQEEPKTKALKTQTEKVKAQERVSQVDKGTLRQDSQRKKSPEWIETVREEPYEPVLDDEPGRFLDMLERETKQHPHYEMVRKSTLVDRAKRLLDKEDGKSEVVHSRPEPRKTPQNLSRPRPGKTQQERTKGFGVILRRSDDGEEVVTVPQEADPRRAAGGEGEKRFQLNVDNQIARDCSHQIGKTAAEEKKVKEEAERLARERAEKEELERRAGLRAPKRRMLQPLPRSWEERVNEAAVEQAPHKVLATLRSGETLSKTDLQDRLLLPKVWLNDNVVNGMLGHVGAHVNETPGPNIVVCTSFFWPSVLERNQNNPASWGRGSRRAGIKKDNLLSLDAILIPICENSHWTLAMVRPQRRTVAHMDSMRAGRGSKAKTDLLLKWVRETLGEEQWLASGEWHVEDLACPLQTNGYDCGVFTILNAACVALGLDASASYRSDELDGARRRIAAVLLNGGFSGDLNLDDL